MAEFCGACGSMVIDSQCSNKNCSLKPQGKVTKARSAKKSTTSQADKVAKPSNPRRSSKCITYNLNDLKQSE